MRIRQITSHLVNNPEVDQWRIAQAPCCGMLAVGGTRFLDRSIGMEECEPCFSGECFA